MQQYDRRYVEQLKEQRLQNKTDQKPKWIKPFMYFIIVIFIISATILTNYG